MAAQTVYVDEISSLISKEQITELFSCCGQINQCVLNLGPDGKKSATISFEEPSQATAAVALSGTMLGDCAFTVSTQPRGESVPAATETNAPGLQNLMTSTQDALLSAQLKREEEISRTIYVGNLRPDITEEQLAEFLSSCGEVVCVKHCNNTVGEGDAAVRYSFVEFKTQQAALTAMGLGGTIFAGKALKMGKALNPIIKNAKTMAKKMAPEVKKLSMTSDIMKRVLAHAARIGRKVGSDEKKEEKNGSDSRKDRDKRRRDRSRSRDRSRDRRRDKREDSRERDRRRRRSSRSPRRRRR